MATKKVDVLRNRVFAIGGHRVSRLANKWEIPASRERLDVSCYEDLGKQSVKGLFQHTLVLEGYGTEAETALIAQFVEESRSYPFTLLRASNIKNSPVATQGSAALFGDYSLFEIPMEGASQGTVKRYKAGFESVGTQPFFGKTLYTNVGGAALADGVFTTPGLNVGNLEAGKILACSVHVLDFPGLLGTTPSVTVKLISDAAADMLSPSVQHAFAAMTTPDGLIVILDGDVTPVPAEPFWGLEVTVGSGAANAQATLISAIALMAK